MIANNNYYDAPEYLSDDNIIATEIKGLLAGN